MSDHSENAESKSESLIDKLVEKIHDHDSSSSSGSDSETEGGSASSSTLKEKVFRLFGRERPVHHVLGGGKRTQSYLSDSKLLKNRFLLLLHFFLLFQFVFHILFLCFYTAFIGLVGARYRLMLIRRLCALSSLF